VSGHHYVLTLPSRALSLDASYKILFAYEQIRSTLDPDKMLHEDSSIIIVDLPDAGMT
tara:strand:+ start:193 stop:366 length:174 start_codon:yes stop_codon:yes gene_type:complete